MFSSRQINSMEIRWLFWLFIFNILLAVAVSCLYLRTSGALPETTTLALWFLSAISHYSSIAIIPFLLFYFYVLSIGRVSRWLNVLVVILFSFAATLLFVDALVYGLYRFHLNGMVWNLIVSGVALEVLSIPWTTWFTFALAVGTIILVQIIAVSFLHRYVHVLPKTLPVAVFLVFIMIANQAIYAWADFIQYSPVTRFARLLPAYHPLTTNRLLTRSGFKRVSHSPSWSEPVRSNLRYPLEELQFMPPEKRNNILIIVIDSWRFDMVNMEVAPDIAEFASDSLVFENNFSAGNTTRFGFFSLLYGIYGTYWRAFLTEQRGPELLRQVRKKGYDVSIYASAPLSNPEFDRTVFVDLLDRISMTQPGNSPLERDVTITEKMIKFLKEHDHSRPFFGLLFYDAIHAKQFPPEFAKHSPYIENVNYITLGQEQDPELMRNTYLNALAFVDTKVGAVLETIRQQGLLDDTVVVITGDHGEEINDLGLNYWGHNSNFAQYQVRTPLIVRVPGQGPRRIKRVTTNLDVVPTLMQVVFGCTTPSSSYSNGSPLTDPVNRQFVHVSTWGSFALVEKNRISIFENRGSSEVVDSSYHPIEGAVVDPKLYLTVLKGMSRFYAR
jgi:membrane-anchored protein YejM (alkaline phosphatase superfamily)